MVDKYQIIADAAQMLHGIYDGGDIDAGEKDDVDVLYFEWCASAFFATMMPRYHKMLKASYAKLLELDRTTYRKRFGEMHGDRYAYVVERSTHKVIIYETQSMTFAFVVDGFGFQVRKLWNLYEDGFSREKQRCAVKAFLDGLDNNGKGFRYGDLRDEGFVLRYSGLSSLPTSQCADILANFPMLKGVLLEIRTLHRYTEHPDELE